LALATELDYATGQGHSHGLLAAIYAMCRDTQQMRLHAQAGLDVVRRSGDRLLVYIGQTLLAWALSRLGEHELARTTYEQAQRVAGQIGASLVFSDWFAAARAEMALAAGAVEDALSLSERAIAHAQRVNGSFAEGLAHRIWAQALAARSPADWNEAEAHLHESLRLLDGCNARLEAAHTRAAWGELCLARQDVAGASEHLTEAAEILSAAGLARPLSEIRTRMEASSAPP
jgi:ATP/maltotriose-dependent transcriptional regulator MalT